MSQDPVVPVGSATLQNTPADRIGTAVGVEDVGEAYSDQRQEGHGILDVRGVKALTSDRA